MGLGKTYSTRYLADSNNNTGSANQVLVSTATGINWVDGSGSGIIGGPYLPLTGGTMSGDLYLNDGNGASPSLYFKNQANNYWRFLMESNGSFSIKEGTSSRLTFSSGGNATFSAQASSTATSSGDASSTLTTKGYVDSLITGATIYRGAWDPSGGGYGLPDLSGVTQTSGYYYICSAAGTAEPNGTGTEPDTWAVGDWVIYNDVSGTGQWQKIDNSSVLSGVGTGQTVALWEGAGSVTDSDTLGNAPITVSGNNATFAGNVTTGANITAIGSAGNSNLILQANTGNWVFTNVQSSRNLEIFDSDGTGTVMTINTSGNVGIGTTSPSSDLHIKSGSNADLSIEGNQNTRFASLLLKNASQIWVPRLEGTSLDFVIRDDTWSSEPFRINPATSVGSNDNAVTIDGDANVGIGTASPTYKLDVAGTFRIKDTNSAVAIQEYSSGATIWMDGVDGDFVGGDYFNISAYGATDLAFGHSAATKMTLKNTGNLGIGTTSPVAKLHVYQNDTEVDTAAGVTIEQDGTGDAALSFLLAGTKRWRMGIDNSDSDKFKISDSTNLASSNKLTIDSAGNVGIGTTNPTANLEINTGSTSSVNITSQTNGSIAFGNVSGSSQAPVIVGKSSSGNSPLSFIGAGTNANTNGDVVFNARENNNSTFATLTNPAFKFQHYTTDLVTILRSGNVGIGTTVPAGKLTIADTAFTTAYDSIKGLFFDNSNISSGDENFGAGIEFGKLSNGGNLYKKAAIIPVQSGSDSDQMGISFFVSNSASQASSVIEAMRVDYGGNVGIGTTSPVAKLHVKSSATNSYVVRSMSSAGTDLGGFYESTAGDGEIFLKTSNVATNVRISSNDVSYFNGGNVGIGASSPGAKLDIVGSSLGIRVKKADLSDVLRVYTQGSGVFVNNGDFHVEDNVGIGTTSPSRDLHIKKSNSGGQVRAELFNTSNTANSNSVMSIYSGGASGGDPFLHWKINAVEDWSMGIDNSDSDKLKISKNFGPGLNDYLTLDTSGNVGIGTNSPGSKLEVNSNGSSDSVFNLNASDNRGASRYAFLLTDTDTNGRGAMLVNATSGFAASFNGGNVGIGTDSPDRLLSLYSNNAETTPRFLIEQDGTGDAVMAFSLSGGQGWSMGIDNSLGDAFMIHNSAGGVDSSSQLTIATDGNVGIGTSSPVYPLDVAKSTGSAYMRLARTYAGSESNILFGAESTRNFIQSRSGTSNAAQRIDFLIGSTQRLSLGTAGQIGLSSTNYGTDGQVLTSKGPGSAAVWQAASGGASTITTGIFSGNGTVGPFALGATPSGGSTSFVDVFIDGVYQEITNYTVSGTALSFVVGSEPPIGTSIQTKTTSGAVSGALVSSVDIGQSSGNTGAINLRINPIEVTSGTAEAGVANSLYIFTATTGSVSTLTLPASPTAGDSIKISNIGGLANIIDTSGTDKIMGQSAPMTIDVTNAAFEMIWSNIAAQGWIIIGNV